jgi:hypothetical protein
MVELDTGTNFPAVSVNSLLAVAMMKTRQRWNGTGVPIQSLPHAASFTLSAWNIHIFTYINTDKCDFYNTDTDYYICCRYHALKKSD